MGFGRGQLFVVHWRLQLRTASVLRGLYAKENSDA
jgi:hypothetical protein